MFGYPRRFKPAGDSDPLPRDAQFLVDVVLIGMDAQHGGATGQPERAVESFDTLYELGKSKAHVCAPALDKRDRIFKSLSRTRSRRTLFSAIPVTTGHDSLHELIKQWHRERCVAVARTPDHTLDYQLTPGRA